MQRLFKYIDIQYTSLTLDKILNSVVYRMLFYVNIYGSFKLSKNSPVFWPTLYMYVCRFSLLQTTGQPADTCCSVSNTVVTCEINYFSLCRQLSEVILPEIVSKLFQMFIAAHEYFPYFPTCSVSLK